ncbi:hypothetical protein CDAR_562821 [Caerostris darwini]|uniref:Uncharacterized protein n=1 Tax=Caerostris darwini TaxID=1538125 RepID=A0AAV4X7Z0_9ARAC|nr:hypothetical protein CDAR_562821 [Caerostris darwini]
MKLLVFHLRRCHGNDAIIQLPRINESLIGPCLRGPQHVMLRFTLATPTRQRWHTCPQEAEWKHLPLRCFCPTPEDLNKKIGASSR